MRLFFALVLMLFAAVLYAEEYIPDFKLPDMNNKEIKLEDLLNKGPVLIDFWASWCVPCKKAMPALNKLAEKYDSLTVVVISIDAPKDVHKAKTFLKSGDFKFIGLFDSEKKLAKKLNVVNPPRTFILDKTGLIVYSHDGYEAGTENVYEAKIKELLSIPETEPVIQESINPEPEKPVIEQPEPQGGCH